MLEFHLMTYNLWYELGPTYPLPPYKSQLKKKGGGDFFLSQKRHKHMLLKNVLYFIIVLI